MVDCARQLVESHLNQLGAMGLQRNAFAFETRSVGRKAL
jgi:hypothetical protein